MKLVGAARYQVAILKVRICSGLFKAELQAGSNGGKERHSRTMQER